tara:strand:- start:1108 stop:1323 length:216 start_codon:yes stop_codon:yes gene_type:complete
MTDNLTDLRNTRKADLLTVTTEEHRALIGIAVTVRTLVEYSKKGDAFKFMVESSIDELEKKLKNETLNWLK